MSVVSPAPVSPPQSSGNNTPQHWLAPPCVCDIIVMQYYAVHMHVILLGDSSENNHIQIFISPSHSMQVFTCTCMKILNSICVWSENNNVNHLAYQPSCLLTIRPIDNQDYWPSSLLTMVPKIHHVPIEQSTILPSDIWSIFATIKPFTLLRCGALEQQFCLTECTTQGDIWVYVIDCDWECLLHVRPEIKL